MHLNGDDRQVVLDRRLYKDLMAYADQAASELGKTDQNHLDFIHRHVCKFNHHIRDAIPLAVRPSFLLQQQQECAREIRAWARRSGMKAYLRVSGDDGAAEYYLPVTIMGRSTVDHRRTRYVVVRPFHLNLEQYQSLSLNRRITGGSIQADIPIKLSYHPITGPMVIHASWMNDRDVVINFAASPSFLKLNPPEGSHECHGGVLDGIWRSPPFLSMVNPSDQEPTDR